MLSLGCGIGDTELLLAPHVAEVVGVDLSPAAIRQARADAERLGIANARFEEGTGAQGRFDAVIAIFFLHHLPDAELAELPDRAARTAGAGRRVLFARSQPAPALRRRGAPVIPGMMKRYQTPDERELDPEATAAIFRRAGFDARITIYDFGSSPLAGLLPGWRAGYRAARLADDLLLKAPALRRLGSNFEIVCKAE